MHRLDIDALTDDLEPRNGPGTIRGRQYAIRERGGIVINGDQEWVRDGRAAESYGAPETLVRDVTVTYGPWQVLADTDGGDSRG